MHAFFLTKSNTEHLKNGGQEEKSKQFIVANIQKRGSRCLSESSLYMSVLTPLFLTKSNTEHLKNGGQEEKSKQFIVANIQKGGLAGPHPACVAGVAHACASRLTLILLVHVCLDPPFPD